MQQVAKDAAEEYQKLCKALRLIIDCLPQVEIYTTTFLEYELLQTCVHDFYVSMLRFWTKACKFYERRRLWKIFMSVWVDYDAEFQALESELKRTTECVEKAAIAKHVEQSELARVEQRSANQVLLQAGEFHRRKEITIWLAPIAYHADYFVRDQEAARALRHPNTCRWVLSKDEFLEWSNDTAIKLPLWIYAKPGAGKTILSSFLIDHYQRSNASGEPGKVFYFFCKDADTDKNTPIAVVRSLLYQLYRAETSNQNYRAARIADALDKSGQSKATDYLTLWELFLINIQEIPGITIILDALDECQEPKVMVKHLIDLSRSCSVRIIFTSRREARLPKWLEKCLSFEICQRDVDGDIRAFIEAKVAKRREHWGPDLGDTVVAKLSEAHEGMFLWVCLMLRELKHCTSRSGVERTLVDLPVGMDMVYCRILQRLDKDLSRDFRDIGQKVLRWVVTALRPLRIHELQHALIAQYQYEEEDLLAGNGILDHPEKNLLLVCGSLITIQDGTVQLIHLSTKEFLQRPRHPRNMVADCSGYFVDRHMSSLQLTMSCLLYVSSSCCEPLFDLDDDVPHVNACVDIDRLEGRLHRFPFIEYAVFSWPVHLLNSDVASFQEIASALRKTYESPCTFCWIETCLTLDLDCLLRILFELEKLSEWIDKAKSKHSIEFGEDGIFIESWCAALIQFLEDNAQVLSSRPNEVHFLDLSKAFLAEALHGLYTKRARLARRESLHQLRGYTNPFSSLAPSEDRRFRLQQSLETPGEYLSDSLGVFIYDERRDVFFSTAVCFQYYRKSLYVQDRSTGSRLPPAVSVERDLFGATYRDAVLSLDGKFLGIFYLKCTSDASGYNCCTLIWRIDDEICFTGQTKRGPWAKQVFNYMISLPTYTVLSWSQEAIVFGNDGCFYSPCGIIDPYSGSRRSFTELNCQNYGTDQKRAFSGDGLFLFLFRSDGSLYKTSTRDFKTYECFQCPDCYEYQGTKWNVSRTGRYVIFFTHHRKPKLFDTTLQVMKQLQISELMFHEARTDIEQYYFSFDESKLFLFCETSNDSVHRMDVQIFESLSGEPHVVSKGSCVTSPVLDRSKMSIQTDGRAVWLTKIRKKTIVNITLTIPEITFPKHKSAPTIECIGSKISDDGARLCMLSYGEKKVQVRILDSSNGDLIRHLCIASPHFLYLPSSISPDLGLLGIGSDVFHINNEDDSLASTAYVSFLGSPRTNFNWCFSRCNNYIACTADFWFRDSQINEFNGFALFQVQPASRTSTLLLNLPLPRRVLNISAYFHPRLPVVLLSYAHYLSGQDTNSGKHLQLHIGLLSLETLTSRLIYTSSCEDVSHYLQW